MPIYERAPIQDKSYVSGRKVNTEQIAATPMNPSKTLELDVVFDPYGCTNTGTYVRFPSNKTRELPPDTLEVGKYYHDCVIQDGTVRFISGPAINQDPIASKVVVWKEK